MTSKGQVLIPKALRDAAGLAPGQPYKVELDENGHVLIAPLDVALDVEQRLAAQAKALESMEGRYVFGASTDRVMRDLRGDYQP
jgi:AbrB family looped-hinge helix DNA binding protein